MGAGTFNGPSQGYGQPERPYQQQAPPPVQYGAAPPAPYGVQMQAAQGKSGMAVAGLVLGIIAMLTFWVWGAIIFAPLAITFGTLGRNEARKQNRPGAGLGTAGLVLGVIAAVLTVPWAIYVASL